MSKEAHVWLGPGQHSALVKAIEQAGGTLTSLAEANAVVWSDADGESLGDVLHAGIEWVQLNSAGVEDVLATGLIDQNRIWTGAQGAYGARVAEHVLAFVLAGARRLPQAAREGHWTELPGDALAGKTIGIVGAGGIGLATISRLEPFDVEVLALTRSGHDVPGTTRSYGPAGLAELLNLSDYVVLAAPLTNETRKLIGSRELGLIGPTGWLVNVSRGPLVDTDALVSALEEGIIAGACLDVTDPEPLPDHHPLWRFPNVLITPHVANPWAIHHDPLAGRVAENVLRFRERSPLVGVIDPELGY